MGREPAAALMAAPGADDPIWQAIAAPLRRLVREGAYGSWFGRVGFHGLTDGVLQLSTPSQIAADRIKSQYLDAVLHAAEVAVLPSASAAMPVKVLAPTSSVTITSPPGASSCTSLRVTRLSGAAPGSPSNRSPCCRSTSTCAAPAAPPLAPRRRPAGGP